MTVPIQDITLRDYFAAQAIVGLMNNGMHPNVYQLSFDAYKLADAMIEARKNDPA
jgi:hypothetical protein